jgi:type VI secretion system protein ImpC
MADEATKTQGQATRAGELTPLEDLLRKVDLTPPSEAVDIGKAIATDSAGGRLSLAVSHLVHALAAEGRSVDRVDKVLVDEMIGQLDEKLSAQINAVLHDAKFQQIESAWRSLKFLVDRTDFRKNIKIEVLNCSKEDLREDFEDTPEPVQSGLYNQIYKQEYDQPGAEPVGAVIANFEFGRGPQEIALLQNVSKIAAATHAPFISAVGHEFFGLKSIDELPNVPDLAPIFEQAEYTKWNAFRDSEDSRYVGLTIPRFLLRLPYGPETVPVKAFNFREEVTGTEHDKYLWGNASMAFAANLTRSFADNGWCVNIRGPKAGGVVEDLPLHLYESGGDKAVKIPSEVLVSDRREFEMAELGFIPLSFYKNKDYACFFSAHSAQRPKKYNTAEATANSRLCANLPYLFLVSRLAHYLKVIQRENIGAAKEEAELKAELELWLKGLVTETPNPGAEQKAKWPLRAASVNVTPNPANPGFYHVEMRVRPHFQIEGVDVDLSLVSQMPRKK